MDVGDELKELNLTSEEIDRFTSAFRDEQFREMLLDYAQEISDPDNRKRYEEEIKLLEQERGNSIEFIHPTPFRVIKTSVAGSQKCYVNICSNEKIGKPEFKSAVSDDGRRGQCWSLPHSFHPGRQNKDSKGNKYTIYDVVFHPDTLHIATKNNKLMDTVYDTAIKGIQKSFQVTLDENNVREIKTKYKGVPQPCVIRKPMSGYEAKNPSEELDPLAFPYPDVSQPQTKPMESPPKTNSSFQIQPQKPKEPTIPNYAVKYRSVIDLQDFRCSRDSAQSPRPKEIVITIDLPLLKSAEDACLEVQEKVLLLESRQPAYRLELPLAYPVDEDNGQAKFNKRNGQLTVTLPVQPPHEAFDFCFRPATPERNSQSGDEKEKGGNRDDEEEKNKWGNGEFNRGEQEKEKEAEERRVEEQETREEKCEDEAERGQKNEEDQIKTSEEEQKTDDLQKEHNQLENKDQETEEEERELPKYAPHEEQLQEKEEDGIISAEEETFRSQVSSQIEEDVKLTSALESTTKNMTNQKKVDDVSISEGDMKTDQMFTTDASNRGGLTGVSVKQQEKDSDGDDLPAQQIIQLSEHDKKPPVVLLREIDADGNETVISDHSTSAGFIFQNKLMYELD